jgi:hypothetical protein
MRRLRVLIRVGLPVLALIAWAGSRYGQGEAEPAVLVAESIEGDPTPRLLEAELDAPLSIPGPAVTSQQTLTQDGNRCGRARSRASRLLDACMGANGARGPVDSRAHAVQLDRLDYAAALSAANAGTVASRSNAPPSLPL